MVVRRSDVYGRAADALAVATDEQRHGFAVAIEMMFGGKDEIAFEDADHALRVLLLCQTGIAGAIADAFEAEEREQVN